MTGCHSDIDLKNIDSSAELEMGVALPIGSMHATIGDFLGDGQVKNIYVDSLENTGVITWKDTFDISRNYHPLDLSQYISETNLNLNVYDQLQARGMIGTDGKVTGTGAPVTLDFPITLRLKGINESSKLQDERLDSALIETASFTSIIRQNNLPLQWDWIDQVTLDLGPQINRPAGNTMTVYSRGNGYGYGENIPTAVNDFSICMMKNRNPSQWTQYLNNVIDTCDFTVHFTFTIPTGEKVDVPQNSGFSYKLGVQFVDYKAVWGMFSPSTDMYDESEEDFSDSWGDLAFLKTAKVPFAEPRVDVNVTTYIAGAMVMHGEYLYTEDIDGNKVYAAFTRDGRRTYDYHALKGEYLPLTSQIGDSTDKMNFFFSKAEDHGQIDRLVANMPQKIGYKFLVDFDQTLTPQIRLTNNTSVKVKATATLPLIFNQGLFLSYQDTVDVDLSKADIDSIINDVEYIDTLKATDLKLVLKAINTIPVDVKASIRCLDAAGNMIMDPEDPTKPFLIVPEDTVRIVAPKFEYRLSNWAMVEPGQTVVIASVNKKRVDILPLIKKIVYYAQIDDESMANAYKAGNFNVRITEDAGLKIGIGLTTKLDAIFNFNKDNK